MGKTTWVMVSVTVFALVLAGCEGEPETGGESAAWMPADAAIPPRPDASYEEDTGTDPDRVCYEAQPLPEAALPRCTASTRDCVDACGDGPEAEACRNACWSTDTTPRYTEGGADVGCNDCIFAQLIYCLDRDGCADQVAAFYCCIVDQCSAGGEGCVEEQCGAEISALFSCGGMVAPECFRLTDGDIGECYADVDPPMTAGDATTDAAMADAGVDADGGAS